jgi:hypothetical protein
LADFSFFKENFLFFHDYFEKIHKWSKFLISELKKIVISPIFLLLINRVINFLVLIVDAADMAKKCDKAAATRDRQEKIILDIIFNQSKSILPIYPPYEESKKTKEVQFKYSRVST